MNGNSWIMYQEWENLFFMHWAVPASELRPYVPNVFEIDEYDEMAWIAIVPFTMNNIRFKGLPSLPFGNKLIELNVRTYVKYKGAPGVYFITLDANHRLGVFLARQVFSLPYVNARMRVDQNESTLHYTSRRIHKGYPKAQFHAMFETLSPTIPARPGSLMYG
nr:DUF2071 domain-containing protein [Halobacillus yeomjeoni]